MAGNHLVVLQPCRDQVRIAAHTSCVGALIRAERFWNGLHGQGKFGLFSMGGVQAAEARTELWKKAVEIDADWMLWLDDDVEPPLDTLESLYKATPMGDIVTGFYWRKTAPFLSVVGRFNPDSSVTWIDPDDMKMPYEEVHAIGFGCVLMRRKVVDHVALECNSLPFLTKPGQTEDVYFGNAARRMGYKIIAVRDLHCRHVGDYSFSYADRKAWIAANPTKKPHPEEAVNGSVE